MNIGFTWARFASDVANPEVYATLVDLITVKARDFTFRKNVRAMTANTCNSAVA